MTQASAYEACSCMCMPQHMHKMLDVLKKACLVWLKKGQGVWQIARLKQRFLSFFYYIAQRSYKKIVYLFVIWLVQWWKLYCIYILFTQRTIDFHRLKRNKWWNNRFSDVFTRRLNLKHFASLFFWKRVISCFK